MGKKRIKLPGFIPYPERGCKVEIIVPKKDTDDEHIQMHNMWQNISE